MEAPDKMDTGAPSRILIVDDEPSLAKVIKTALTQAGYACAIVAVGPDILTRVVWRDYDLLITDVVMPDVGGLDIIKHVQEHAPAVKIMAISGGDRHMPAHLGLQLSRAFGACEILYKPFSISELIDVTARALRSTD